MSETVNLSIPACILLCQHRSCRKAGASKVLQAFRELAPQEVSVIACGCLGHCGSGPNAVIMPEEVPYDHLQPKAAAEIVRQYWG